MGDNTTYKHWYELNPSRLEMEKLAMSQLFPEFELDVDSATNAPFFWRGTLSSEKLKGVYEVLVVYTTNKVNNNLPCIYVAPLKPSTIELISDELKGLENLLLTKIDVQGGKPIVFLNLEQDIDDAKIRRRKRKNRTRN